MTDAWEQFLVNMKGNNGLPPRLGRRSTVSAITVCGITPLRRRN